MLLIYRLPYKAINAISRQADEQEEQNRILAKQLEHMIEKKGTSKNQSKQLHDSSIKMFLFATALDIEEIPNNQSIPARES